MSSKSREKSCGGATRRFDGSVSRSLQGRCLKPWKCSTSWRRRYSSFSVCSRKKNAICSSCLPNGVELGLRVGRVVDRNVTDDISDGVHFTLFDLAEQPVEPPTSDRYS